MHQVVCRPEGAKHTSLGQAERRQPRSVAPRDKAHRHEALKGRNENRNLLVFQGSREDAEPANW